MLPAQAAQQAQSVLVDTDRPGEQPDRVCNGCEQAVTGHEEYVVCAAGAHGVYHKRCCLCTRCSRKHVAGRRWRVQNGQLLCQVCATNQQNNQTLKQPLSGNKLMQCTQCEHTIEQKPGNKAHIITPTGNMFCESCFQCRKCKTHLAGQRALYELMGHLYCTRCESAYRFDRYELNHMGCGHPGGAALRYFEYSGN